jgi:hypothetical protein
MGELQGSDRSFDAAVQTVREVASRVNPDLAEIAVSLITLGHEHQFDLSARTQVNREVRKTLGSKGGEQ